MTRANRYSPEVRERAVRMLHEQEPSYASRWAALTSVAGKIGCTPETLRKWVQRIEVDDGRRRRVSRSLKTDLVLDALEQAIHGSPVI